MKRNNLPLGDIVLINQYGKVKELGYKDLRFDNYTKK